MNCRLGLLRGDIMPVVEDWERLKRHPIAVGALLLVLVLAPAHEGFANISTKRGVSYFGTEDAFPSYLYLLSPSDQAEVEKARANIERIRKSNVTINIVDENGDPLEGVEVAFNQTDHNFLFGFNDFDPFALGSATMMKQAGFNLFVACAYWNLIEPNPDEYKWNFLEMQRLEEIRSIGFKIKVHPVVYYDPGLSPSFLRKLTPAEVENETLAFVSELLRKIPNAEIYELSNEANWESMRGGLTIDQFIYVLKEVASMIRAVQGNATLTVNTSHTFGEEPRLKYEFPNMSPYDWNKFLISNGVDFDAVGVQFRPGYFTIEPCCRQQNQVPQLTEVSQKFDRYAALGKRVHITEFQLPSRQLPEMKRYGQLEWNETVQAAYVEGFYTLIFGKSAADSIVWWFITSAMPTFDEDNGPRPFERSGQSLIPKASYYMLKNLITNRWSTRGLGSTDADGNLKFSGFGGAYILTVTHNGLTKRVNIHVKDRVSVSYRITFDRAEILKEMEAERIRLRNDAKSVLQELDRIRQWLETISEVKSAGMLDAINSLLRLYEKEQYAQVVRFGKPFIENPLQIQLNGKLSDLEYFVPLLRDKENDVALGSPSGTDVTKVYAFADSSYLYIGIAVLDNQPNKNLTFTTEIETYPRQRFHVAVSNGTVGSCWQEPWEEGGIYFPCSFSVSEVVEIQVSIPQLKSPEKIWLKYLFVWRESTRETFDECDGPRLEVPSLRSFQPKTTLMIEKTETTTRQSTSEIAYTTSTVPGALGESSLPYVAAICVLVILGVIAYWRRKRQGIDRRVV